MCIYYVRELGLPARLVAVWITPPQNKDMSDILRAPQMFFPLPEACVNLPGPERLQNGWCPWKDSAQYGMELEPSGAQEGTLTGWLATSIWYLLASLLAAWDPLTQ